MNIRQLYKNPEVKSLLIKTLVILVVSTSGLVFLINHAQKKLLEKLIEGNAAIISNVNKNINGDQGEIIRNFYNKPSEEDIIKGKEILNEYGYNQELSIEENYFQREYYIRLVFTVVTYVALIILAIYFLVLRDYHKIFKKISSISLASETIHKGEFKKLQGDFELGDLAFLIHDLNIMGERVSNSLQQLEQERRLLKDYLGDISHQLKTPLASLVMFNDLMLGKEDMPLENRRMFLEKSEEQLRRMEWLTLNLLKVGRLEAGVIEFNIKKSVIGETIHQALSPLYVIAEKKCIELKIQGDEDLEFNHDVEWLGEAISNLVKNAIEHTKEGGTVTVSIIKSKVFYKIIVEDNGEGIPKENLPNIFKRFYKGSSMANPESVGIGLYLTKGIIENLGGSIRVSSEINVGSRFEMSFPIM